MEKVYLSLCFQNCNCHYLKSDILECEVKWASTNKASGGDGIPVELFQILKDDAVKVLYSICQQIWKTQQWPQDWKRSIFISMPKKVHQFSSLQSLSRVRLFATPWIAARHASLSITNSQSLPKLMSIESVVPSSYSSSVVPFSSCPQSLPASESFPMSQQFTWGGQSTWVSAFASFLPKKSQGWSPSEWTGWISLDL